MPHKLTATISILQTQELHAFLVLSEPVGSLASIFSEIRIVGDNDFEAQYDDLISFFVGFDSVLHGATDSVTIPLPVVDGMRESGDCAFENGFPAQVLQDSTVCHVHLGCD